MDLIVRALAILCVVSPALAQGFVAAGHVPRPGYDGRDALGIDWCTVKSGNTLPCDGKEHVVPQSTLYEMGAPDGEQKELRAIRRKHHLPN